MLTIIIPALNEEKYLPKALESIKTQDFECEIVVADARPTDRIIEIVKDYRCRIVDGGRPAKGRNEGAKIAAGDLLLFIDADVVLPPGSLKRNVDEFLKRGLDIATCSAIPLSHNLVDRLVYSFANYAVFVFQKIRPFAQGFCIFAKKSLHDKIGGFDETIQFGEDSEYVLRASKFGKFGILGNKIYVSARRFEKEGRLRAVLKYLYLNLYRLIRGEIRKPVNYDFGDYD